MKETNKEKVSFLVSKGPAGQNEPDKNLNREKLKKPIVFAVMGIIFAACLYLIFGGDTGTENGGGAITLGINDVVPQASEDVLHTDKGKAYEEEMLKEKDRMKREALATLSDYWQVDSTDDTAEMYAAPQEKGTNQGQQDQASNPALGSYQNMQRSLEHFYQRDTGQEELRRENEKLKEQLEQQNRPANRDLDRLQLMEKSYQMAAKYFPGNATVKDTVSHKKDKDMEGNNFLVVLPKKKTVVSKLRQQVSDSVALQQFDRLSQSQFRTATEENEEVQIANSIRACVHQSIRITGEGSVQLRLLQPVKLGGVTLPAGFIVTAITKFQTSRLQLQVVSIEIGGRILQVNLTAYDLDGQKGLQLPYAPEVTAVNSTLANMGNTAGGSFTINRNAGQQLTSDATRGLVQGVSGYFSKKVKPQKATLNTGYQLFLVSKEK